MQTLYHDCVFSRDAVAERLSAVGGRNSGGVEKIFHTPGDSMQRSAVMSGGDFFVSFLRLRECQVARECDDAVQPGIELLKALQINAGETIRGQLALIDPARKLGQ